MTDDESPVRIAVLWRGDRTVPSPTPPVDRQLTPLFEAFAELPVTLVAIPYDDEATDAVATEILECDGVLVWVNPVQDGANRALLDAVLRDAVAAGVYVSANPEVIAALGTKEILFHTRDLGWGCDTAVYSSPADLNERFPARLNSHGNLVLKQARGNGGFGVWRVTLDGGAGQVVGPQTVVQVYEARRGGGEFTRVTLASFLDDCAEYFTWSGAVVDQEYQPRLVEGMIRCYLCHDEVVGFARQWPSGLLSTPRAETPRSVRSGPEVPEFRALRESVESQWVPQMIALLGLGRESLPVIWDADFLFGPIDSFGRDTYVLCEINVSAVWPFPSVASGAIARAAVARARDARRARRV